MGGSGSGSYFSSEPQSLIRQIRDSQDATAVESFEVACNSELFGLLSEFNDRDTQAVNTHLDEIAYALSKDQESLVRLAFGGSVAKRTYVEGLSDVDCLVYLDNTDLENASPQEAKDYLEQRLKERFPRTLIKQGRLAVTVQFSDCEIQLLPAKRAGDAIRIPDQNGETWSSVVRPREFAKKLTDTNAANGGKVVPVVKLAKAIIANLGDKQKVSGYHAESLAVEAFENYQGPQTPKAMLVHYFKESAQRVMAPIQDSTGQSVHVDEYLGSPSSLERRIVADAFARVERRMRTADTSQNVADWLRLFDA
jgi:Second Messenger Oligonucleotide or Dinucleotide Synthetase domain